MIDPTAVPLAPLQGCLYCHSEGTTALVENRRWLPFGSHYPTLRCSHCGSAALFDLGSGDAYGWRICYRRVNHASRYFYVALYLGRAGWLAAQDALEISTDGYVQRKRVQQARDGNLEWLQPAPLRPPPPLMSPGERVYLTLKAVTLQEAAPHGVLFRPGPGAILDSGKLYVTDQKLHLLGQRRDWSHRLADILALNYDEQGWSVELNTAEPTQYHGVPVSGQMDAQLITVVIETLRAAIQQRPLDPVSYH